MFASMTIVFREGLEMAIIVSLLLAATKDIPNRSKWILGGTGAGVIISVLLAILALNNATITTLIEGKVTGGIILALSSILIGYTVIWMKSNGMKASQDIKASVNDIKENNKPLFSLSLVAFFCVFREGIEVVLFLLGLTSDSETTGLSILSGSLIGAIGAIAAGVAMYFGFIKINLGKVFNFFAILMSFLAAGMAMNAVSKFTSAGIINPIINPLWNSSALLDHHSNWFALFIHVMFGYTEKPSLAQLIAYVATLSILFVLTKNQTKKLIKSKKAA
ncbi:iron permease [Aliivibrio finisterrensis]|uniref:FTR1 family iron permease n=1 Tax=Aliivibrio finisterrensis TaxID=511998 RepID=UPI00101FC70A|nr:iron permease [Aliivibrio finisterrensis]RYU71877.1 iron permease [Aliivibrio finisterrensis]RYU75486.1 iron permease [Aliivibrio finisterrensis]